MTRGAKVAIAVLTILIIGVISAVGYAVTTFLFHFSGGQSRMGPVVDYGAIAVVALSILLAAVVWRLRSPAAAGIFAAVATPVVWVLAAFVEWLLSFSFGA